MHGGKKNKGSFKGDSKIAELNLSALHPLSVNQLQREEHRGKSKEKGEMER